VTWYKPRILGEPTHDYEDCIKPPPSLREGNNHVHGQTAEPPVRNIQGFEQAQLFGVSAFVDLTTETGGHKLLDVCGNAWPLKIPSD
jgi:hypothetical protein